MIARLALVFVLVLSALAADTGGDLLAAAHSGDTARVRALLKKGVNLKVADENGKTALIWAAEKGRTEVVRLLLAAGADAQTRDNEGLTASELALVSSEGKSEAILALLPKPPRVRTDVDAVWLPVNMVSSCFESRAELAGTIGSMALDKLALDAFTEYAKRAGKDAMEIARASSEGLKPEAAAGPGADGAAMVALAVRPGVSCSEQADHLSLAIDVTVTRAAGGPPVLKKTSGGGFTGLHDKTALNPAQYRPFFEEWAKVHASSIYWEALRALLRR
jgi:ankyrin repeat protein